MNKCEALLDRYLAEVQRDLRCFDTGDGRMLVDTPYLYQDGDVIQVVVESLSGGLVRIGDEGAVLSRLELSGLDPTKGRAFREMQASLRAYRVVLAGDELRIEGPESALANMFLRLIGALRAVDGLSILRPEPTSVRFDRRVITFLQSQFENVEEHPRRTGLSGSRYKLTASVTRRGSGVLIQSAAGGHSQTGRRSVEHAFRVFSDINGSVPKDQKLVLLSADASWPQEDLVLLSGIAYVGGWNDRDRVIAFLRGEVVPDKPLLLPFQSPIA